MFQISETATEIRIYTLMAKLQVGSWLVLRADLLPLWLMPQLSGVCKTGGEDILAIYQHLTKLTKAVKLSSIAGCCERISSNL